MTNWVTTWTAAPQLTEPDNLPPPSFIRDGRVLADSTLRQTVRATLGGRGIRLSFSNVYGMSDLSLAEVALRAGFSDQSQFSRHFKRLVGVTPGQFRTPSRIA